MSPQRGSGCRYGYSPSTKLTPTSKRSSVDALVLEDVAGGIGPRGPYPHPIAPPLTRGASNDAGSKICLAAHGLPTAPVLTVMSRVKPNSSVQTLSNQNHANPRG